MDSQIPVTLEFLLMLIGRKEVEITTLQDANRAQSAKIAGLNARVAELEPKPKSQSKGAA